MRYRVIGIDLDGTLIRSDERCSQRNLDALQRAMDAGVMVVPCTGRMWHRACHAALSRIDRLDVGIFANGAAVHRVACGTMLAATPLPADFAPRVIDALDDLPVTFQLCQLKSPGYGYRISRSPLCERVLSRWHNPPEPGVAFHPAVDFYENIRAQAGVQCLAVRVAIGDRPTLEVAADRLARFGREAFVTVFSEPEGDLYLIELFSPQTNKWTALCKLAEMTGIGLTQIAAIGDGANDISMIEGAACGIAMGNAVDQVKAVADRITDSNDCDGVARAIDRLLAGEW